MNLINGIYRGKARWALHPGTQQLFCYLTSRYMEATGHHKAADGTWDLPAVKAALADGKPIEDARTGGADKLEVANQDFKDAPTDGSAQQASADAANGKTPDPAAT